MKGLSGMRAPPVLIVEDETFLAMDIEHILQTAGYRVAGIAADRAEALAAAPRAGIAFVDLNLRDGRTGPGLACELAARHGMRIVYVTANPSQIDRRAEGAIGVVAKPFRESAIVRAAELAACAIDRAEAAREPDIILF